MEIKDMKTPTDLYNYLVGKTFTCELESHFTTYTIEPIKEGNAVVSWGKNESSSAYSIETVLQYLEEDKWTLKLD